MAAISVKNFIAPFQNKMQLGTIIIIGFLVVLFRISGGGVSSSPRAAVRSAAPSLEQEIELSNPVIANGKKATHDPLAGLLDDEPKVQKRVAPPDATANKLNDVRRALGLE